MESFIDVAPPDRPDRECLQGRYRPMQGIKALSLFGKLEGSLGCAGALLGKVRGEGHVVVSWGVGMLFLLNCVLLLITNVSSLLL